MEEIEVIQAEVKTMMSEERYNHSIGVMKKAEELAKQYGINPDIAKLVGLTHDIAKEMPNQEKLNYAKQNNIEIDDVEAHNVGLLHAKIGADITKKKYGFTEDMQNAIKYHTVGEPNMDLLAKIIFVADKIEENRNYEGIEELRKIAKVDIDSCLLTFFNYAIKKNIDEEKPIHPNSLLTRNKLLYLI